MVQIFRKLKSVGETMIDVYFLNLIMKKIMPTVTQNSNKH